MCFMYNLKRGRCRCYVVLFTEIVHFVQSKQEKHENYVSDVAVIAMWVSDVIFLTFSIDFQQT